MIIWFAYDVWDFFATKILRGERRKIYCAIFTKKHTFKIWIHDKLQRDMTNKWIQKEQVNSNT